MSAAPEPPASLDATSPPPGWGTLSLYALPAAAAAAPSSFVHFYFLSFATDALLLAPAAVGLILAAGRVWDAVTDPLAGYASDRTHSRFGRRRPWMALAAPASALAFLALWSPPAPLTTPLALYAWSAAALFAFTAAITAWIIPHQALAVELSDDPHVRTGIFGARFAVALSGIALAFLGMQHVGNAADPRATARGLSAATALCMLLLLLVPALWLREPPTLRVPIGARPFQAARDLIADPTALRLLAIWFATQLGTSAQGVIAPYMSRYVVERPELMGVMPALFIAPLVASIPFWIALTRRFGRKRVWLASMLGGSASYALLFLAPLNDFTVTGALLASAGFWTGCAGPVGPSLFASVVDADARRSGERREGMVFAAKEFVEKASSAAVALVVGMALQLAGFEPNAPQSPAVQLAIRGCLGLLPGLMLLVGAVLLVGLGIDDERAGPRGPGVASATG